MKIRQRNLKIFEFEKSDSKDIIECIKMNFELMEDYCLAFHNEISGELLEFLMENKLNYINLNRDLQTTINPSSTDSNKEEIPFLESKNIESKLPTIFSRSIRSGEEIVCLGDAIFFKNIHSGARIICNGNLQIFGKCEADLNVNGEYIILKDFNNARVSFQENIIDQNLLNDEAFKIIYLENATIKVDIIKG